MGHDMRPRLAALLLVTAVVTPVRAEQPPVSAVAATVPIEVTEVVTGGNWVDGAARGVFRTVTVVTHDGGETAAVYLQWIGSRSPAGHTSIISNVPFREFNDQRLASASITLEADVDGAARIVIAGQDANATPTVLLTVIVSKPGEYQIVPPVPTTAN
jgi:hypothetical protein